jgi:hypothetical protein
MLDYFVRAIIGRIALITIQLLFTGGQPAGGCHLSGGLQVSAQE